MPDLVQLRPTCLSIHWQWHQVVNRTRDLACQQLFDEERFRGQWSSDTNTIGRPLADSLDHTAGSPQAASDVDLCLFQQRSYHLCKLDEVRLSGDCALFLVLKGSPFECSTRQIHKVDSGLFKPETQVSCVVRGSPFVLELDRIELHAYDEARISDTTPDFLDNLEDDS